MPREQFDVPIEIVNTADSLANALPQWFSANLLAIDIECSLTGFHHCVLALLQIATHNKVWVIDSLAIPHLIKPLLLAISNIPWIVHDFSSDGIVYKRIYNVSPSLVLDTMFLARHLGYSQPNLKNMVKVKLGFDISKDEQHSNWLYRPLREAQISYAARDVVLLLPLLRNLAKEVELKRCDPIIGPELARLPYNMKKLLTNIRNYKVPEHNTVLNKVRHLGLGENAVVMANKLMLLRQKWGNEGDVSAVMGLGNKWIIERLKCLPRSKEALESCIFDAKFRQARIEAIWAVLGDLG